jgi:RNA polymerase sigma-70 factor (ECF subfamily)
MVPMPEERPEISHETIRGFVENEAEAIEMIVRAYSLPLYYFIYGMIHQKEAAEDVVQESFSKAWKSRNKFDLTKNFKTWLFTIGRNTAIDFLRKEKNLNISQFEGEDGSNSLMETVKDESINLITDLDNKLNYEIVSRAMDELSSEYATVLNLRYKESFSFDEIADILKRPSGTVRSQHSRALTILRKKLKELM